MILINDDCLIQNKNDLNSFTEILKGEGYDDVSIRMTEIIGEFLFDVWERLELFSEIVHKKISNKIIPIAHLDMSEVADFDEINITAFSEDPDFVPNEKQKIMFLNLKDKYFKSVKTLQQRFSEAEKEFE